MSLSPLQPSRKARLQRPEFPVSQRMAEAAAIVADPRRGKVVELARRHGISRQSASYMVTAVRQACLAAVSPGVPGRPPRVHTVVVDSYRIASAVVSLAVDGHASNSGTQACIQTMLNEHVATGRISTILHHAAERATQQLQALPMPDAPVYAVTDELYDHCHPVLALMEDQHLGVLFAHKEEEADGGAPLAAGELRSAAAPPGVFGSSNCRNGACATPPHAADRQHAPIFILLGGPPQAHGGLVSIVAWPFTDVRGRSEVPLAHTIR